MAKITLQGNEMHTNGSLPNVGSSAPDFVLVNKDLENVSLSSFPGKRKILSIVPSLDTPVCAISTKKFDDFAKEHDDTAILIISADLSVMRSQDFSRDYGVLIEDGPLSGITARAIVVLDPKNQVVHTELVGEIAHEPDYKAAIQALGSVS